MGHPDAQPRVLRSVGWAFASSPIFIYSVVGIVNNAGSFGPVAITTPTGHLFCGVGLTSGVGGPATPEQGI